MISDVASGSGTVGGVELSRGNATNTSEDVPESFVTSGGFSTLEGIAQRQADVRFVGACMDCEGEGLVPIRQWLRCLGKKQPRRRGLGISPVSRRKVFRKIFSN